MDKITLITFFLLIILISCNSNSRESQQSSDIDNLKSQFNQGKKLMREKKYDKAIILFTKQIQIEPSVAALYEQRANSYSQLNKHDSAIADMNIAINLNPQNISLLCSRGQLKFNAGYFVKAIIDFDSVLAMKPDFNEAYLDKGLALLNLDKKKDACEAFLLALKYGNPNAQEFINRNCKK